MTSSSANKPTSSSSAYSFSSFSNKQQKSSSPLCCGTTETTTTTITSSPLNYWTESSTIDETNINSSNGCNSPQQISDLIANCLICFWPTMQSLRAGNDDEDSQQQRPHNDCFVAVSSPSQLLISEPSSWHHASPSEQDDAIPRITNYSSDVGTDEQLTSSLPTRLHISLPPHNQLLLNTEEEANNDNVCHQRPPRRLTPVAVQSQSITEEQHCNNGMATLTSNTQNTYHRRTDDISLGFFTAQTLDEIHVTTNTDDDDNVGSNNTPRSRDHNQQQQQQYDDNVDNNNHRAVFQTPGNRVRLNSDSFRQTIKVVTCEKRRISDESDVSPIDSDAGFSPILLDSRHRRVAASENLSPLALYDDDDDDDQSPPPMHSSQKRLFDDGDSSNHQSDLMNHQQQQLSPLSEFGMSVMKSLQSIIQGGGIGINIGSPSNDKENKVPPRKRKHHHTLVSSSPSTQTNNAPLWNDTFLPKSSTFLKALRRSGRQGKVLVQGWVAFRQDDISWEDIIHHPKRCDFRYIILLDNMPIVHLFTSRPRRSRQQTKKMMPKPDLFKDCISIDLSGDDDVAVRINFVSKELGNEVCIFHQDVMTNEDDDKYSTYSLLPIPLPQNVFLDKHQSRLAKGGVLESVFVDGRRVSFNSENYDDDGLLMLEKSSNNVADIDQRATTQQYDVARHLLFVIDATIFKSQ